VFQRIAVILFTVCLSVPAFSQQRPSGSQAPMRHHEFGMMRGMASDQQIDRAVDTLQQSLKLTESQTASIRELARSRRDSIRTIRDQAKPKVEQLMTLLHQTNPDPAAVGRIVIELDAIHQQVRTKQADMEKQLTGILNPEQQQIVKNLRDQAETFIALRRIGLLGAPEFPRGMFMSR
jgi:Spy/CpxP family protein refolding chaperone